jgi:PAS domain S-box-containing protein
MPQGINGGRLFPPPAIALQLCPGIGVESPLVQRERVQMERESAHIEATSERAEHLANLLTLSYQPMFAWRLGGPIEFWNAAAERLYGFALDEAVGRVSHSLLQTKFPIELTELRSQLCNERYWSGALRHTCKDGREVIVDSRMQLLRDGTVLEANRDVTEVKALGTRQAALMRDLLAAGAKFEAVFNQSGIFAGIRRQLPGKRACPWVSSCRWSAGPGTSPRRMLRGVGLYRVSRSASGPGGQSPTP